MATLDDVRAIAIALPGVIEKREGHRGGVAWRTRAGMIAWERPPGKADLATLQTAGGTWPDGVVLGVHTDGLDTKEALIESFPDVFFTIAHFDGYPAVLVTLESIERDQLVEVVTDAWLDRVPKTVASRWLAGHADAEA